MIRQLPNRNIILQHNIYVIYDFDVVTDLALYYKVKEKSVRLIYRIFISPSNVSFRVRNEFAQ